MPGQGVSPVSSRTLVARSSSSVAMISEALHFPGTRPVTTATSLPAVAGSQQLAHRQRTAGASELAMSVHPAGRMGWMDNLHCHV